MDLIDSAKSRPRITAPSEYALLDWLRVRISPELLDEISKTDYGNESDLHLAGIRAQLSPYPTLGLLPWWPREVLELQRWSEPDQASEGKRPEGERGHFKRLLACLILLRNVAYISQPYSCYEQRYEEDFFLQTSAASVVQFTRSAIAIGIPKPALGFLLWLVDKQQHPALRPFVAFSVLVLALSMNLGEQTEHEYPEHEIMEIFDWVNTEEQCCRAVLGDEVDSSRWLIGLNSYECLRARDDEWIKVADELWNRSGNSYSPAVKARLRQLCGRLAEK